MNRAASPRLLLVLPIVPWPVRRDGISLRFAPIIDYLARRYEMDVLVLAEADESPERHGPLQLCRRVTVMRVPLVSLPRPLRRIRVAWSAVAPWDPPIGAAPHLARRTLERRIADYLQQDPCAVVIWAAGHLDVACRVRVRFPDVRFVIDQVDSPALAITRARIARRSLRFIAGYTTWKWRRLERKVQAVFDATIYVSEVDARAAHAAAAPRVHVIPNGITFAAAPGGLPKALRSSPVIGFLGNMDYEPNVSAALRLARQVFPRILACRSDARLLIIGRNPARAIQGLHGGAITVTGTVVEIWPYVTRAAVFVFPMMEGAGLQNKILEAMYAEVPVVSTPSAAAGVGGLDGEHLLVGDSDADIAERTLRLLRDPAAAAQLATRAKRFVMERFNWQSILPRYEALVAASGCARDSAPPATASHASRATP